jgi:hypothetical protein
MPSTKFNRETATSLEPLASKFPYAMRTGQMLTGATAIALAFWPPTEVQTVQTVREVSPPPKIIVSQVASDTANQIATVQDYRRLEAQMARTLTAQESLAKQVKDLAKAVASISVTRSYSDYENHSASLDLISAVDARQLVHGKPDELADFFDDAVDAEMLTPDFGGVATDGLRSPSALLRAASARVIATLGGVEATKILQEAFEQEKNDYARAMIQAALRSTQV